MHTGRLAVDPRHEKAGGVGLMERRCVMQAGIPALARGPVNYKSEVVVAHGFDGEACHRALRYVSAIYPFGAKDANEPV